MREAFIFILAHGESRWFPTELPPLHPLLVNFTAALVPVSVVADLLGRWLRRPTLAATGWWTIAAAAAVTPFTALAGWLWLRQMPEMVMPPMPLHQWLGTAFAIALIPLAIWRGCDHVRSRPAGTLYLVTATLLTLALALQGHLGASMSFSSDRPESGDEMREGHDANTKAATMPSEGGHGEHGNHSATVPAAVTYTCTMHPEVVSDKPGTCPKCGMKLVVRK